MATSKVLCLSTCAICRDDENVGDGTNMVMLKCGHAYHSECLKEWERTVAANGGSYKCSYCNVNYPYGCSSSSTRHHITLRSISVRRAQIIEQGEPSPKAELDAARKKLNDEKSILNLESDRVRKLEADLAQLRIENKFLQNKVKKVNTESDIQNHRLATFLKELEAEKQKTSEISGRLGGQNERLEKRANNSSAYIEKLEAERQEAKKNVETLRNNIAKTTEHCDKQVQVRDELRAQVAELNQANNQLREMAISMEKVLNSTNHNSGYISSTALHDLNGGFKRLEAEYLALKGLFDKKLQEATNKPDINSNPMMYGIQHIPHLVQPIGVGSLSPGANDTMLHPSHQVFANGVGDRSGTYSYQKDKGKQPAGIVMKTPDPIGITSNYNNFESEGSTSMQKPIATPSNSNKVSSQVNLDVVPEPGSQDYYNVVPNMTQLHLLALSSQSIDPLLFQ